ncbi:hypothetical protein CEXT_668681 [Caerostris extrusa]|uniref:Uncharacterized protein n=1 Tax=Caerostris extrusa TaxID=172846 RepID=A0AAV4T409_CAEEX|nr:hypothetical protein CEXT_668681 [Caerostris extrusa]
MEESLQSQEAFFISNGKKILGVPHFLNDLNVRSEVIPDTDKRFTSNLSRFCQEPGLMDYLAAGKNPHCRNWGVPGLKRKSIVCWKEGCTRGWGCNETSGDWY